MKVETKTTTKTITLQCENVEYISEDGIRFKDKKECIAHETRLHQENIRNISPSIQIPEWDEMIPLSFDGSVNGDNTFRWYRLHNEEDFQILNAAYHKQLNVPRKYPEIICVETCGFDAYEDYPSTYDMTTCLEKTKAFWEKLGYHVAFTKGDMTV